MKARCRVVFEYAHRLVILSNNTKEKNTRITKNYNYASSCGQLFYKMAFFAEFESLIQNFDQIAREQRIHCSGCDIPLVLTDLNIAVWFALNETIKSHLFCCKLNAMINLNANRIADTE